MDTTAVVTEVSAAGSEVAKSSQVECLIHVRFNQDGTVAEIGERPQAVKAQDWFKYLSQHTVNRYQALAGGRGMFRLPRPDVNALKAACSTEQSA